MRHTATIRLEKVPCDQGWEATYIFKEDDFGVEIYSLSFIGLGWVGGLTVGGVVGFMLSRDS